MSPPKLSVVVASVNGLPYLADCLEALSTRAPEAEVVVADWTDEATRRVVRERFPQVKLLSFDEPMAVPELRAAGIFAANAPYVALIEDHCNVVDGWATRLVAAHEQGHPVVGGSIRNFPHRRIRDWAAFLCEYSRYMEPAPAGAVDDLPGMNVSYDRRALQEIDDLLHEGRWESWLHARLHERGYVLWCDPGAVLDHAKDFGFREFLSQRYHYSRSYAGMRNAELGRKRLLYALGSPLILPLMYWRIARNVLVRRRHRRELALATPLILVYMGVWAAGEALGYAFGGGRSLLQVR
ncbi:MAG: glycosyltransferase [Actinobacteria bacterium]|nr:glycosyltransferase [Actinomycetota bacterium]